MNRRFGLALVALLTTVVTACTSSAAKSQHSGPYQGVGLEPPQPRPSFTLTDTTDKPFSFGQRTAGHTTLLFFGYTECPDVCPTTMANINQALSTLPASVQKDMYVVFVSTDVKHDTGPMIKDWLANFTSGVSATFVGLRGTQAQIDAAQTAAHIPLAEDGGRTHSTQVLLFGTDDYARVTWLQTPDEAGQMTHDLAVATKAKS
jgi:protein SCO1/2